MKTQLSIIYVYFNTPEELHLSLCSIQNSVGKLEYEVIIVDNNSPIQIPEFVQQLKRVKVIKNKTNLGYGAGINVGLHVAKGELLLITNPDVIFRKDTILQLAKKIKSDKRIGIVAPQLVDDKGNILPSISEMPSLPSSLVVLSPLRKFPLIKNIFDRYHLSDLKRSREHNVPVVGGACFMIRKNILEIVGGFDSRFFMYFEEADICSRVRKVGFDIRYFPKAKVTHFVGSSLRDKDKIQKYFERSRFLYFRKYYGTFTAIVTEVLLRFVLSWNILLFPIVLVALFLNLYNLQNLMMFFGDFGRDYLAARDILLTGTIPLVGIRSSVVWLHQGPLSIYLIALALLMGNFNPIAPAVMYALLGVVTTTLVFFLGKIYFNTKVALLASLFYATSPLVIINAREPYHTASIPFFACLFFLVIYKVLQGSKKLLPVLFLVLGLLLQLELSNVVLFVVTFLLLVISRKKYSFKLLSYSFLSFIMGILPFLLYDFTHRFVQTVGFFLWIINRIRLFLGLTTTGNATIHQVPGATGTIFQQMQSFIFPLSAVVTIVLLLLIFFEFYKQKKLLISQTPNTAILILFLWLIVPLLGYVVHAAPGTAYFPLLFPVLALMVGLVFYRFIQHTKLALILFLFMVCTNVASLLASNYYLTTPSTLVRPTLAGYSLGFDFRLIDEIASFVVADAKGEPFTIVPGGFLKQFPTGIDNYNYLSWYKGGHIQSDAKRQYIIYENENDIQQLEKIVYNNRYIFVVKHEKN